MDPHTSGEGEPKQGPAQSRYNELAPVREPYLIRARAVSKLTLPYLFREAGADGTANLILPWSNIGAYCVNNLAAKLLLTMYPDGIPFIQIEPSKSFKRDLMDLEPMVRGELSANVDAGLAKVEREFSKEIAKDGDRVKLFDTIRHQLAGGTHGLKFDKDGLLQSIPLYRFVNVRDPKGTLVEFVIEDPMVWETLPDDIQDMCKRNGYRVAEGAVNSTPVSVYTHGKWKRGKWTVYQECLGEKVPGSEWKYNADVLPYLFAPYILLAGEHYGRSAGEDSEADFQSVDAAWQMLLEGGAAIARLIWLVKPGGSTNKSNFEKASNGSVLTGDPEDVKAVRSEKQGDLAFILSLAEKCEQRLFRAWVVTSVRNGERVTAEEIKLIAQELEATLGGVYSNQVATTQSPYARLKLDILQKQGRVTKLPKESVDVTILAGEAALGRQRQGQALDGMLADANTVLGPQVMAPYVNIETYLKRSSASKGVDTDGLIRTTDQVKQEQAQLMQAQTAMSVAPEIVKQGGEMLQNNQQAGLEAAAQGAPQ